MRRLTLGALISLLTVLALAGPAAAGITDVGGDADDDTVTGTVDVTIPGQPGSTGGGGGPICHYEPLKYTTQDEQRDEIRPEETRPGAWGWWVCDDGRPDEFMFFPDAEPIDPTALARSVHLTPPPPVLRTSPDAAATSLVNLETWFWAAGGDQPLAESTSLGAVAVTVTAAPRTLLVDPGDGTGTFTCPDFGTAYDRSRPAASQSTSCGHTYRRPGTFTATATLVYDVGFTSNVGAGGPLGTIEPSTSVVLTVRESQAVVVGS